MSKQNRDPEALVDIFNAAKDVVAFTNRIRFDEFKTDKKTQNATLYSIQIIGEATKRLSVEFREANPQIVWRDMAGMRDKIVHDYNGINFDVVWGVVKKAIPELLEQVAELISDI